MLFTTHVAVGSVLGRLTRSPGAAAVLGLASHFVLDAIPHWGDEDRRVFLRVAVIDGLVGGALTGLLAWQALGSRDRADAAALSGALAAGLPDWDKPVLFASGRELWPDTVNRFHRGIQAESDQVLLREALVCATATLAALAAAYHPRRRTTGPRRPGARRRSRQEAR